MTNEEKKKKVRQVKSQWHPIDEFNGDGNRCVLFCDCDGNIWIDTETDLYMYHGFSVPVKWMELPKP